MALRNLLSVSFQSESTTLGREIGSSGWILHSAMDLAQAQKLIGDEACPVGLVLLERNDGAYCRQVEALVSSSPTMEWMAAVQDTCVMTEPFRDFVLDNFYTYQKWPPEHTALLLAGLEQAWERAALRQRRLSHDSKLSESTLVGDSPAMKHVFRSIRKIAAVDAPTLITGESGTGKELVAVEIHGRSARSEGSFVAVNCGALPHHLIQSELFGHERGAFTGAYSAKKGLLESAAGGTVFLDEIGDLSLELQTNLLRFLQEHTINRIGSTSTIPLQVRVLAATHVHLESAVKEGRFREDLYYRLNVLHLVVPPLRERTQDIPQLAQFFFDKFCHEKQLRVKGFSHRALQAMISYPWPGNVRELINRIRRAMVMCDHALITPTDLGFENREGASDRVTLDHARETAERNAILLSLQSTNYNISKAARQLSVSRVTLYRLMQKHRIWEKVDPIRSESASRRPRQDPPPLTNIPSPVFG